MEAGQGMVVDPKNALGNEDGSKEAPITFIQAVLFWATLGSLLIVAIVALVGAVESPAAGIAVGTLLLVAVTLALGPRGLQNIVQRLHEVSVGKLTVKLGDTAVSDAHAASAEVANLDEIEDGETNTGIVDLRLKLQKKLAYIAKDLLPQVDDRSEPTFVTLGSLAEDGYISEAQARTLDRLSILSAEVLQLAPASECEAFVADAQDVVRGLRATVFRAMLDQRLRADVMVTSTAAQTTASGRPVHLSQVAGQSIWVVAVFAISGSGVNITKVANRDDIGRLLKSHPIVLVVPNNSDALGTPVPSGMSIVHFADLGDHLHRIAKLQDEQLNRAPSVS
jgi:hypothetical protein